jgi:hypothetical protein
MRNSTDAANCGRFRYIPGCRCQFKLKCRQLILDLHAGRSVGYVDCQYHQSLTVGPADGLLGAALLAPPAPFWALAQVACSRSAAPC